MQGGQRSALCSSSFRTRPGFRDGPNARANGAALHLARTGGEAKNGEHPENEDNEAYWTRHNVTLHAAFPTVEASLEYFDWRNDQYPGYIDLMPVQGQDGKVVLDYGCGPGTTSSASATSPSLPD